MKLGITGLHGTGKTTLLNALREVNAFRGYAFCDEVTRWVKSLGFDINEAGGDQTQMLIVMKHIYNLTRNDYMITDRTMLDCLVYSRFLREIDQISQETLDNVRDIYEKTINKFDRIFLLKAEFNMEDDGVRSVNPVFRDRISEIFDEEIANSDIDYPLVLLTGTVEERVSQLLNELYTYESGKQI